MRFLAIKTFMKTSLRGGIIGKALLMTGSIIWGIESRTCPEIRMVRNEVIHHSRNVPSSILRYLLEIK
jgi:hypothetical protein